LLAFMAGAVAARIVFWAVTNRMFDDGLTTITHARNVPLGLGLVHHVGEGPVHGFTSALGVLIPLVGELIHEGSGMFAMRIGSLVAVCVALAYARSLCRDLHIGPFPTAFALAYLAFDQNMIFFGMSGMETQVAVAILLAGVYHVRRAEFVPAGIWLGLAPLVRPEFVLWLAPALVYLAVVNVRRAALSAGIAAAIVAPWVVFTTLYYGSPIPNTILAKSNINPTPSILTGGSITPWFNWLLSQFSGHLVILLEHLQPFREVWSTASTPIPSPVLVAVAIGAVYFFVLGLIAASRMRDMWPAVAFLGLFFAYRVYFLPAINYYEWYLPPFLAVMMIVVALGMQRMSVTIPAAPKTAAVVLALAFAIHMPFSFVVEGKVQSIEDQVRTNAALYLKAHVQPGESVVSESAGYVGFYSGVKLYDYPGLTSKVSVRALKALPPNERDIPHLIAALKPDWVMLRPWELGSLTAEFPDVAAEYQVQKVFAYPSVPDSRLDTWGGAQVGFAGYDVYNVDMKFTILKRTATQ
ncbi:MAG TPA: hypothetical protein VGT01_01725, partial [Candidatus Dormibacteraeota bacterium]|nr:hypothetical protein [Candidatus Dormibacteraeota bacterium]